MKRWQAIVKPRQCVFALALPTTEAEFRAAKRHPNRDFVQGEEWPKYQFEVISELSRLLRQYLALGARVYKNVTLADYQRLFAVEDVSVIVLIAHWGGNSLELCDGHQSLAVVAAHTPSTYNGVLDLCACEPGELAKVLGRQKADCLVRYSRHSATPAYWLHFYHVVLSLLADEAMTYPQAIVQAIRLFTLDNNFTYPQYDNA